MSFWRRQRSDDIESHIHIGEDMLEADEKLDDLNDELFDDLGAKDEPPAHDGEASESAKHLAAEHGTDYRGFGHPPEQAE